MHPSKNLLFTFINDFSFNFIMFTFMIYHNYFYIEILCLNYFIIIILNNINLSFDKEYQMYKLKLTLSSDEFSF